jgi:hypothetical protein
MVSTTFRRGLLLFQMTSLSPIFYFFLVRMDSSLATCLTTPSKTESHLATCLGKSLPEHAHQFEDRPRGFFDLLVV